MLNGIAKSSGNACVNQRPASWLPYKGDQPGYYLANNSGKNTSFQSFTFAAGTYTFSLLPGSNGLLGGDIAGNNGDWGYYIGSTLYSLNGQDLSGGYSMTFDQSWGIYVELADGAIAYSGNVADKQFALFSFSNDGSFSGNTLNYTNGSSYILGLEDTRDYTAPKECVTRNKLGNCSKWSTPQSWNSDWDYNDIMFQISTPDKSDVPGTQIDPNDPGVPNVPTPEPTTLALLVAGMAGLFTVSRRRRENV